MNKWTQKTGAIALFTVLTTTLSAQSISELQQKITELENELIQAKSELSEAKKNEKIAVEKANNYQSKLEKAADTGPKKIEIGNFKIGGAIRANYAIGDYASGNGPTRGAKGGNFGLDTFRINVDYADGPISGKLEYRWYNGYNMLHTGWIGYNIEDDSSLQIGVNRVPFGPGAYGVSNSWFFDQHYYVGLSDDMDTGIKYTTTVGNWTFDFAYYFCDEGNWMGASADSARYSYDPVVNNTGGYAERHQVNLRGIYKIKDTTIPTEIGFSLQYGQLDATAAEDGDMYALSVHMKNDFSDFSLATQLTYYNYDISNSNPWNNGDLILMGAFDYAYPVASKAFIPALSISKYIETKNIDWLDAVTIYAEYSSIIKDGKTLTGEDFNDSSMFVLGAAWWRGGWYIYTDWAYSDGNYFVGGDHFTNFGENLDATWQGRFNINFGYYF